MKRLTFKKPFNGMDNALKLIPESYKVDGKEFQITDGTETYNIRWDINEATVLRAENKNLINEDMNKIKHLMGFKSQETLGNLKGEERLNENSSFTDIWNKTKSLLSESKEEVNEMISGAANGLGFTNEGNLEENEPIAEMEREIHEEGGTEEEVSEDVRAFDTSTGKYKTGDQFIKQIEIIYDFLEKKGVRKFDRGDMMAAAMGSPKAANEFPEVTDFEGSTKSYVEWVQRKFNTLPGKIVEEITKGYLYGNTPEEVARYLKNMGKLKEEDVYEADADKENEGGPINVQDIRKDMKTQLYTLNKADFDAKERKVVDFLLGLIEDLGKEGSAFSPRLMKLLGLVKNAIDSKLPKNEPVDSEDSTAEIAQDAMAANQNEQKDRFDEIFEDMYTEEEEEVKNPGKYKTGMKKGYDTDGDGVPDGADKDPYDGNIQEGK